MGKEAIEREFWGPGPTGPVMVAHEKDGVLVFTGEGGQLPKEDSADITVRLIERKMQKKASS